MEDWVGIKWEFSSRNLLTLKHSAKKELFGSLNSKSTYIWESLIKVTVLSEGFPSMGVIPKSIFEFYILTFGIIILALNGILIVFPPLIIKETHESIFIDKNAWILNTT